MMLIQVKTADGVRIFSTRFEMEVVHVYVYTSGEIWIGAKNGVIVSWFERSDEFKEVMQLIK